MADQARDRPTLEALSLDEKVVRFHVAINSRTPGDILHRLSKDKATLVRLGVANNPGTPARVLAEMWDQNPQRPIANAILRNPKLAHKDFVEELTNGLTVQRGRGKRDASKKPRTARARTV